MRFASNPRLLLGGITWSKTKSFSTLGSSTIVLFSLVVIAGLLIRPVNTGVLWRVDFFICMLFLIDFGLNLWRAPSRSDYFFVNGGWLDLLGTIPTVPGLLWTSIIRLARLNRFVRVVKYQQGKDREEVIDDARQAPAKTALLTIVIAAFVLVTFASIMILRFERRAPGATIRTGADSFWWALVTVTTVGYGDYVPVTFPGRILATVLMTFGIGIFAVLTGFLATKLLVPQEDKQEDEQDVSVIVREEMAAILREEMNRLRQENAAMRAELAELNDLLKKQLSSDGDVG